MSQSRRLSATPVTAIELLEKRIAPATHVWVGPANGGLWSNAANWTNGVPTTGEGGSDGTTVQFNGNVSSTNNIAGLILDQLHFTAGGNTILGTGNVTLGFSGAVQFNNLLNDAGNNTIDDTLPVVLTGGVTIFAKVTTGKLTIESNIGGVSASAGLRVFSDSINGTLSLSGPNNTYAGTTTVASGTLELNSIGTSIPNRLNIGISGGGEAAVKLLQSNQIADSALVVVETPGVFNLNSFNESVGSLELVSAPGSASSVTTGNGTLTLLGDASLRITGVGGTVATISGKLSLPAGDHVITVADAAGSSLNISANVSGAGSLTKAGPGTLQMTSATANTYTGATTVAHGTLFLNGATGDVLSETIFVGDGIGAGRSAILKLGQLSEISSAAAVTIRRDGMFDNQSFFEEVGDFTVETGGVVSINTSNLSVANLNLQSGSFLDARTPSTISAIGTVTLGGRPSAPHLVAPAINTVVTIITNDLADPVVGTFDGVPEGGLFGTSFGQYRVSYVGGDGNDVTLTFVDGTDMLTIAANGKSATYTDVDGDLVTIKTTKGDLHNATYQFGSTGAGLLAGFQLQKLVLNDPLFAKSVVTITAKATALGGNGRVNVGAIESNQDLVSITLAGDLGRITVSDGNAAVPSLAKLTVDSIGEFGTSTQRNGSSGSLINGIGALLVKGNVRGSDLSLGTAGMITVSGSLIALDANNQGNITVTTAKKVALGGSLIASLTGTAGAIAASGDLGSVVIGHNVVGSARISSAGKLGTVLIKGSVTGESVAMPAVISGFGLATAPKSGVDTAITGITIGLGAENLVIRAGYNGVGVATNADASIGKISIGGDFRASSILVGAEPGGDGIRGTLDDVKPLTMRDLPTRFSTIASLVIKGQALGTTALGDVFGIVAEKITAAKIGGVALKLKSGPNSLADTFALGFASAGNALPSDLYLHEIA